MEKSHTKSVHAAAWVGLGLGLLIMGYAWWLPSEHAGTRGVLLLGSAVLTCAAASLLLWNRSKWGLRGGWAVACVAAWFIVPRLFWTQEDAAKEAVQELIAKHLKTPSTAKYISTRVAERDEEQFIVHAVLDAQNEFGAMIRHSLCVSLKLDPKSRGNFKWYPASAVQDCTDPPRDFELEYVKSRNKWSTPTSRAMARVVNEGVQKQNAAISVAAEGTDLVFTYASGTAEQVRAVAASLRSPAGGIDSNLRKAGFSEVVVTNGTDREVVYIPHSP